MWSLQVADASSTLITQDGALALLGLASAIILALVGGVRDHRASVDLRSQLEKLEAKLVERELQLGKKDETIDKLYRQITAHRHYENDLIAWGAHSREEPPREPPDPPNSLMGEAT